MDTFLGLNDLSVLSSLPTENQYEGSIGTTHEMASTMARPIMMEQAAWSSL